MRGFLPVLKRELLALFVTPLAWVVITSFLLVQGLHFYLIVAHYAQEADLASEGGPIQAFFGQTMLIYLPLLFICPLLTMRLFAEERRSGTIELLLTVPVTAPGVVLGKYAAALATYVAMWAPTGLYVLLVSRAGRVDWRVVGSSYLGVFLVGAAFLALGVLTSALTKSQLTAAVLSSMATIALFMFGIGAFVFDGGLVHDLCSYVSVWSAMTDFSRGIIDLRRLVFWGSITAVSLFVTTRAVEAWRWG